MCFSFRSTDDVRTLHVRASNHVMNRAEVIHKHVAPNKTATGFTLLVVGTIALMLLRVHNRIERAALTRRETVVAFFGKVLGNLVLITHKCTPLVLVRTRVVGLLVQRHEKIILLIRLLGITYRLRITDRRTDQTLAMLQPLRPWEIQSQVGSCTCQTGSTEVMTGRFSFLRSAMEATKTNGDQSGPQANRAVNH